MRFGELWQKSNYGLTFAVCSNMKLDISNNACARSIRSVLTSICKSQKCKSWSFGSAAFQQSQCCISLHDKSSSVILKEITKLTENIINVQILFFCGGVLRQQKCESWSELKRGSDRREGARSNSSHSSPPPLFSLFTLVQLFCFSCIPTKKKKKKTLLCTLINV